MKSYASLPDALADLKSRGYGAKFEAWPFCLYCGKLDLKLNPEQFNVDEVYRFEAVPDQEDISVLFAISSSAGIKGTLVDGYGPYAEIVSFDIAQKLRVHYT